MAIFKYQPMIVQLSVSVLTHGNCNYYLQTKHYQSFPYTTPGALFRKSMSLDTDFLNNAPGLYMENSGSKPDIYNGICRTKMASY